MWWKLQSVSFAFLSQSLLELYSANSRSLRNTYSSSLSESHAKTMMMVQVCAKKQRYQRSFISAKFHESTLVKPTTIKTTDIQATFPEKDIEKQKGGNLNFSKMPCLVGDCSLGWRLANRSVCQALTNTPPALPDSARCHYWNNAVKLRFRKLKSSLKGIRETTEEKAAMTACRLASVLALHTLANSN